MFPYWALFGGFSFAALVGSRGRAVTRAGVLLWVAAIAIILMIGLRYRVGGDWFNYLRNFYVSGELTLGQSLWLSTSDPGYSFISWIAHQLEVGIWFVNLICGAVLIYGIMKIAVRQPNPWLVFVAAIPYLIIVVGMGYTRQAAAIGFVLVGISSLLSGSLRAFVLATFAAVMFHKSAMIILPIVALAYPKNRVIVTASIAFIMFLLFYFFLRDRLENLTQNYIQSELESKGAAIRVSMNVVPAITYLLFQKRFCFDEIERQLWRNMSLAALAAAVALSVVQSSTIVDRLALYLVGIQLVVLARVPWAFAKAGATRIILMILVILYSAVVQYVWLNYATYSSAWVPYRVYPLFE